MPVNARDALVALAQEPFDFRQCVFVKRIDRFGLWRAANEPTSGDQKLQALFNFSGSFLTYVLSQPPFGDAAGSVFRAGMRDDVTENLAADFIQRRIVWLVFPHGFHIRWAKWQ